MNENTDYRRLCAWADKFWGFGGIFGQFINTHFGTVSPLNMFSINQLWQYGMWSFQTRGTKVEIFLPKNQHTQMEIIESGELG